MSFFNFLLIVFFATTLTSATKIPQVYEELDENPPPSEYKRFTRHLNNKEKTFQASLYNFGSSRAQPDHLKVKYYRQQQADLKNLNPKFGRSFNQKNKEKKSTFISTETNSEWKPFQPTYLANNNNKDLTFAASETNETIVKSDRNDHHHPEYIYVTPNNVNADEHQTANKEEPASTQNNHQLVELQQLIGQNPDSQLQGLQKILANTQSPHQEETENNKIQIEHNGSPSIIISHESLEGLQQHLDAVNKAKEEELLAAAQKQADAHIKAQHAAIALVEKQAHDEAYAKIAEHNNNNNNKGAASNTEAEKLNEENIEVSALQERPLSQVAVPNNNNNNNKYAGYYTFAEPDLRNSKPRILGAQYLNRKIPSPQLYQTNNNLKNYSPVSPYITAHPHSTEIRTVDHIPVISTTEIAAIQQEQFQHVVPTAVIPPSTSHIQHLYHHHQAEVPQYASKYAFGYRVLDEKHGNDYGHREERNGKLTKGQYFVKLPDGRHQKVQYYADKNGYHAKVSYDGVGIHPEIVS